MVTLIKPSENSRLHIPPEQPACKEASECHFLQLQTQALGFLEISWSGSASQPHMLPTSDEDCCQDNGKKQYNPKLAAHTFRAAILALIFSQLTIAWEYGQKAKI